MMLFMRGTPHLFENRVTGWRGGTKGTEGSARCNSICRICFRCIAAMLSAVIVPTMIDAAEIPIVSHVVICMLTGIYSIGALNRK